MPTLKHQMIQTDEQVRVLKKGLTADKLAVSLNQLVIAELA